MPPPVRGSYPPTFSVAIGTGEPTPNPNVYPSNVLVTGGTDLAKVTAMFAVLFVGGTFAVLILLIVAMCLAESMPDKRHSPGK
jgi:hypothetical protein